MYVIQWSRLLIKGAAWTWLAQAIVIMLLVPVPREAAHRDLPCAVVREVCPAP